jgi:gamma-glutamyltranspeptidase / glutathione hydrolase
MALTPAPKIPPDTPFSKGGIGVRCACILTFAIAFAAFTPLAHAQRATESAPEPASDYTEKKVVTAKKYMVVAAHPLAVDAGLKILDAGGSATDAAIAVQMVLNLVEPQSSGIGGGAFMMHFDAKKDAVSAYDGREVAPMGATPELFLGADGKPIRFFSAVVGGRSVGVPGVLRMLELAHARHGKLPWARLFDPAIALAENGFPMSARTHAQIARDEALKADAKARAYFYLPDGSPKPVGAILKNAELAAVFKRIAREGTDAFYLGSIARDVAAAVRTHANPGSLSEDDLRDYRARSSEPVCGKYRAYKVCGVPPPSAGGIAMLQILGALERFEMKLVRPNSTEAIHLITEAERLAYADRERFAGDDRFTSVPVAGLIAPAYNQQRSELIRPEKAMGRAEAGTPVGIQLAMADGESLEFASTSQVSIVDAAGNAISMTTSIESGLGSRIFVHGFLLNNQLTDFSMLPTSNGKPVANAVQPGKRPRSAMSPTLVFDAQNRLHMVLGSPGGPPIIYYVAKALVATLDWGMDIQSAISLPNFGSRNGPTEIEKGTPVENLTAALKSMGHEVRAIEMSSGLHGIMRTSEGWQGGADPRREGIARGK